MFVQVGVDEKGKGHLIQLSPGLLLARFCPAFIVVCLSLCRPRHFGYCQGLFWSGGLLDITSVS